MKWKDGQPEDKDLTYALRGQEGHPATAVARYDVGSSQWEICCDSSLPPAERWSTIMAWPFGKWEHVPMDVLALQPEAKTPKPSTSTPDEPAATITDCHRALRAAILARATRATRSP